MISIVRTGQLLGTAEMQRSNSKCAPVLACLSIALASCTSSGVTQTANNQAIVSTSAAPVCGTSGAMAVASQMAAVATLRQGYQRFIIANAGAQNNTRVVRTGPTFATTTGTFNRFGNNIYGNTYTTFGGQQTIVSGSNDAQMLVAMFNPGDPGYENALDAKQALGPNWERKVKNGISSCF